MPDLFTGLLKNSSFGVWDVVIAAVVLVAGWIVSVWARKGVAAGLAKWSGLGPTGTNTIARLVRYAILLLTVGIVLTVLGAPLQPVLAAVVIVSVVAFLALRGIAANFGAGLVIQARHPVRIGDYIEVQGVEGRIAEMTGRSVLLRTSEGRSIRVPNTTLLENPLGNASENGTIRSEIRARIHRVGELDRACLAILDAVQHTGVRGNAKPEIFLRTVTLGRADVTIRFWSSFDDRETARSDVVRAVSERLAEEGLPGSVSSEPMRVAMVVRDALDDELDS